MGAGGEGVPGLGNCREDEDSRLDHGFIELGGREKGGGGVRGGGEVYR